MNATFIDYGNGHSSRRWQTRFPSSTTVFWAGKRQALFAGKQGSHRIRVARKRELSHIDSFPLHFDGVKLTWVFFCCEQIGVLHLEVGVFWLQDSLS